jgi:hypothetical protein
MLWLEEWSFALPLNPHPLPADPLKDGRDCRRRQQMRNRLPLVVRKEVVGVELPWQDGHLLCLMRVSTTNSKIGWAQRLDLDHQVLQREHLLQDPKYAGQSHGSYCHGNRHVHLDVSCSEIPTGGMADFGNSQGTDFDDTGIGLGCIHVEEIRGLDMVGCSSLLCHCGMAIGFEESTDYAKDRVVIVGNHHDPGNGRLLSFCRLLCVP